MEKEIITALIINIKDDENSQNVSLMGNNNTKKIMNDFISIN